ncbi:hypothetical protein ILYODFUR_038285, partial [Ilyodon furcidens]
NRYGESAKLGGVRIWRHPLPTINTLPTLGAASRRLPRTDRCDFWLICRTRRGRCRASGISTTTTLPRRHLT